MSNEKLVSLSGDAGDVLYTLFFRGALQSGDIPSKAGANELREAGLTHTQHTSTRFGGEDYFTFLTAEGQRFAIQYLAETNFGRTKDKPIENAATKIRLSDDMREAVIDAIRESDVFKALLASQDAHASALVTTQQAIEQAASDAIRNALKPGGLLYRR